MEIAKMCTCGMSTRIKVDAAKYAMWQKGVKMQDALPELHPFEREVLISGTCFECQEKLFSRPAPGHEAAWGKIIGECECCGASLYSIRHAAKGGGYVCSTCGERMEEPT